MRHVVLDEADLLLTGGYERDTLRILKAFLEGDKQQRASAAAIRFGLTDDMLQRMPRQLRKAAQTGAHSILTYLSCWHTSIPSCFWLKYYILQCTMRPRPLAGSDMNMLPQLSTSFAVTCTIQKLQGRYHAGD